MKPIGFIKKIKDLKVDTSMNLLVAYIFFFSKCVYYMFYENYSELEANHHM